MKKDILKLVIISLCISAFMGIIIVLSGEFGELEEKILETSCTIFGLSITGLCCSALYGKERYKSFSILGMITTLFACIWFILEIWDCLDPFLFFLTSNSDFISRMSFTLILLTPSLAHISLILLIKNYNLTITSIKNYTILFSIILDIMILNIIWELIDVHEIEFYGRLIAVLVILVTLGTIVAPILNKVYKVPKVNLDNENSQVDNNLIIEEVTD